MNKTVTWLPSQQKIVDRLTLLDQAEAALETSGIGGIYDDFKDLVDAIEQMAAYIKEIEARLEQERRTWKDWGEDGQRDTPGNPPISR